MRLYLKMVFQVQIMIVYAMGKWYIQFCYKWLTKCTLKSWWYIAVYGLSL